MFLVGIVTLALALLGLFAATRGSSRTAGAGDSSTSTRSTADREQVDVALEGASGLPGETRRLSEGGTEADSLLGTRDHEAEEAEKGSGGQEPALLVRGAGISSSLIESGMLMLRFPLLRPEEDAPRTFYLFGASTGADPTLLASFRADVHDSVKWPIVLDLRILEGFDQGVVTTPAWSDEPGRILATITHHTDGVSLSCPKGTLGGCLIANDTRVDSNGLLVRRWEQLRAGGSREVARRDVGLIRLAGPHSALVGGDRDSDR